MLQGLGQPHVGEPWPCWGKSSSFSSQEAEMWVKVSAEWTKRITTMKKKREIRVGLVRKKLTCSSWIGLRKTLLGVPKTNIKLTTSEKRIARILRRKSEWESDRVGESLLIRTGTGRHWGQPRVLRLRPSSEGARGGKGGEGAGASKYPSRQLLLVSLRTSSLPEQPATLWVAAGWRRGQNTQQRVLWVGVGGREPCIFSHMAPAGPCWARPSGFSCCLKQAGHQQGFNEKMSRYGSYGLASSYRSSYLDSGTSGSSYSSPSYSSYASPTSLPYESKFDALTAGRGSRAGEKVRLKKKVNFEEEKSADRQCELF